MPPKADPGVAVSGERLMDVMDGVSVCIEADCRHSWFGLMERYVCDICREDPDGDGHADLCSSQCFDAHQANHEEKENC